MQLKRHPCLSACLGLDLRSWDGIVATEVRHVGQLGASIMSELDDLPSWAGRNTEASPRRNRRKNAEADASDQSDQSNQADQSNQVEQVGSEAETTSGSEAEGLERLDQPKIDVDETATVEVGGQWPLSEAPTAEASVDEVSESIFGLQDGPQDRFGDAAPPISIPENAAPPPTSPRVDLPPPQAAMPPAPTIDADPADAMTELNAPSDQQLPTWEAPIVVDEPTIAARPAAAPPQERAVTTEPSTAMLHKPKARRGRKALLLLLGLAIVGALAAGGFLLLTQDSSETAADGDGESAADGTTDGDSDSAPGAEAPTEGAASEGDTDGDTEAGASDGQASEGVADGEEQPEAPSTVIVPEDDQTETSEPEDGTDSTDGESQSTREAVFRDGMVYLSGRVPSQEISDIIEQKAAAVVGPDNVVNDYIIDPTVELNVGEATPLYVEDVVLFEFNSVAIAPLFEPILDLGVLLLSQNPQASMEVVTRTDAVGSEEVNLEVARQRAQSVINYMVQRGVNPDQITADPRGEEGTSENDDEQTAALQRRAEFTVIGLLD